MGVGYGHPFLGTDTSTEKLIEMDCNGNIVWERHLGTTVFDLWVLPDDTIVYCHYGNGPSGVKRITRDGEILLSYETEHEIFGCQPFEDGSVMIGQLRQKCLTQIAPDGSVYKKVPIFYDADNMHEVMRSPRRLRDGNYLVVQPGLCKLIRYDENGKILWQAPTRRDMFGVVERENGNLVYSCIDGLGEIDPSGKEIWSLLPQDVPQIDIRWLLGIQLLPNGNIVCCNWLGHGHEREGVPMFEVTPQKEVVWTCDCRNITENLANFQLLDQDKAKTCFTPLR